MNTEADQPTGGADDLVPPDWNGEPRVITFFVPLIWPVGLPENERYTFFRSEHVEWSAWSNQQNFVTVRVWRYPARLELPVTIVDAMTALANSRIGRPAPHHSSEAIESFSHNEGNGTILELSTPLLPDRENILQRAVSDAFDRCLEAVDQLLRAYNTIHNDLHLTIPTRATAFPIVLMATQDLDEQWSGLGVFSVNEGYAVIPGLPDDLDPSQLQKMRIVLSRNVAQDPLQQYEERFTAARRALHIYGDFGASIIFCHTAGEIFFDTLLLLLAWEEISYSPTPTITREQPVEWFIRRESLETRLRRHYHVRLRGGWDPAAATSVLFKWTNRVGRLRNRAVHAGYRPTEREAREAIETLREVVEYVKLVLINIQNRRRYPRTTLLILGEPGLQRFGANDRWFREFLAQPGESSWLGSFRTFREWVDSQINGAPAVI